MKFQLLGFLCFLLFSPAFAVYYHADGTKPQCFIKDLPRNLVVSGKIKAEIWKDDLNAWAVSSDQKVRAYVEEEFENNHISYDRKLSSDSKFSFTTNGAGNHKICFAPVSSGWFSNRKIRIHVDLDSASTAKLIASSEDEEQDLTQRIEALNERLKEIRQEQVQQRAREAVFRNTSEKANSRAVKWTIIQIVVLVITCIWQLSHLQSFFVKEKLV
ncbi:COPII vesicle coat component Erp5/Erp6 [Schizosaccharomyces japonicus yFS275]|uniref:COPII vesicle coat component Erp5/Erp6 n=1 Tax=Schizosaccharomyces japonicus (strain yFS275 / FY16936) TaxID=402676 RepID=B6K791_SCHJY|nr:COPII vesicle coat component Erp5/Erp6 [Schizosaccharomyces japonicus yFS275]EEB09395.1 COPII vesicle coat component Erp5/Erp6 [Schizosaccharomyces japonicus yFS275]